MTIKSITELFSKIPNDKLLHVFYGNIFMIIGLFLWIYGYPLVLVFLLPFLLGVSKEIFDNYNNRVVSFWDCFYTSITGLVVYVLIMIKLWSINF
jgi:hypothetical protein